MKVDKHVVKFVNGKTGESIGTRTFDTKDGAEHYVRWIGAGIRVLNLELEISRKEDNDG